MTDQKLSELTNELTAITVPGSVRFYAVDLTEATPAAQQKYGTFSFLDTRYVPVTLAGSYDYLTLSGQQITLAQIDLTTDITGTLPIANGGSGQTTASAALAAFGGVPLAGGTMTGLLQFSGTTHAGLKLLSLTTTERDALTPAAGMLIYNETTTAPNYYTSAWRTVAGLEVAQTFTAAQTIDVSSTSALAVANSDNYFVVDTTNGIIKNLGFTGIGVAATDLVDAAMVIGTAQAITGGNAIRALSGIPQNLALTAQSGGSLGAGTYYVRVASQDTETNTAFSLASSEQSITINGTTETAIKADWDAVTGDPLYRVFFDTSTMPDGSNVLSNTASTNTYTLTALSGSNRTIVSESNAKYLNLTPEKLIFAGDDIQFGLLHKQPTIKLQGTTTGRQGTIDIVNNTMTITGAGSGVDVAIYPKLGVGTDDPAGKVHIDQDSATGAIPALLLDQADLSEEMIEFTATVGVGNPIEAVGAKSLIWHR